MFCQPNGSKQFQGHFEKHGVPPKLHLQNITKNDASPPPPKQISVTQSLKLSEPPGQYLDSPEKRNHRATNEDEKEKRDAQLEK